MESFINENSVKILNSLSEGIYVIDRDFKIRFVNKAAFELTKKNPNDVLGNVCTSLCRSERCKIGCPVTEILHTGNKIIDLEATIEDNYGHLVPITLNASLLKNDSNIPIGSIISFKKKNKIDCTNYYEKSNHFNGIVGQSKPMLEIYKLIDEISESFVSVVITGETGVGKEVIANAIHKTSTRSDKPFVKVNCGALPENLLASELFGHAKGAFTGASQDRIGRFEYADGGTILLDEITEIPMEMQAQLLRVIQDGTYERVGETIPRYTDVRIITATNKKFEEEIRSKKFREDLFYRLNVVPIYVPPLREKLEDIPELTNLFISKYAQKYNKKINHADANFINFLMNYDWPGNIRELENCIEYAFARSKRNDYLCSCTLPANIKQSNDCEHKNVFQDTETDEKNETLLSLLRQNNWSKSKVAKILGVNRSTIHRRLNKIKSN